MNKTLYVHGPQAITLKEALDLYRLAFHPEINRISVMPLWQVSFISTIRRNKRMKSAGELARLFAKVGELGDPTEANEILGAPETTLEEWVLDTTGYDVLNEISQLQESHTDKKTGVTA